MIPWFVASIWVATIAMVLISVMSVRWRPTRRVLVTTLVINLIISFLLTRVVCGADDVFGASVYMLRYVPVLWFPVPPLLLAGLNWWLRRTRPVVLILPLTFAIYAITAFSAGGRFHLFENDLEVCEWFMLMLY